MNTNQKALVTLLKNFIKDEPLSVPDDTNWMELSALASIHSVSGIMGYMLMQNPLSSAKELLPALRRECLQSIAVYAQRAACMDQLIIEMNKAGIDHLLMKGFVVRNYYSVPELRSFGDIDFLIKRESRENSNELMQSLGFEAHDDWEPVYSFAKGMEYYEIHSDVMEVDVSDKANYREYFSHIWEHATPRSEEGYSHTYDLTPEFHLLYLMTHIAKHIRGSGAGIRMYMDIAVFTEHFRDSLDWDYVKEQFKVLKFEDFANTVFTIVEKEFGVKSPIKLRSIEDEVFDMIMENTMNGGTFGHMNADSASKWMKIDDKNNLESVSKTRTFIHRLFPAAKTIETRYTYLQGRPYLIPIAWIHRLIKTRSRLNQHMEEARGIVNADEEEVLLLRKVYKEIGL